MIEIRGIIPHGVIPMCSILALMPFVGFCLITAAALMGETEGWGIAANRRVQFVVRMCYLLPPGFRDVSKDLGSPVAVWSPTAEVIGTRCSAFH